MRPMMTFLRINLERRFCASKWRKFQEKKRLLFQEMDMRDHHYISRYKKKEERERERVKEEGELVEYSI